MVRYGLCIMLFCFVAAGCAQRGPQSPGTSPSRSFDSLEAVVDQRLSLDPVTAKINFGIESDDGVITLRGQVESAAQRLRAISIVRSTPGVRAVIDNTRQF